MSDDSVIRVLLGSTVVAAAISALAVVLGARVPRSHAKGRARATPPVALPVAESDLTRPASHGLIGIPPPRLPMDLTQSTEERARIEQRAFFKWLDRGQHGHDLDDWLEAEREELSTSLATLNQRRARKAPADLGGEDGRQMVKPQLPEGFDELHQQVLKLQATWKIFVELFTSQHAIDLETRAAAQAFGVLQRDAFFALVMRLARLTDSAKSAGQPNLTLTALEGWVRLKDPTLADEIRDAFEQLRDRLQDVRTLRNKWVAHLDRAVALGQVTLPPTKREDIEVAITGAGELMNKVAQHFGAVATAYEGLMMMGDGKALLEWLSRGLAHVECEKAEELRGNWQAAHDRRRRDFGDP